MPTYKRKPLIVEAHQMTVGHRDQEMLADWCNGQMRGERLPPAERFIRVPNSYEQEAYPGDWIVKEPDGNCYVYKDAYFELTHSESGGE